MISTTDILICVPGYEGIAGNEIIPWPEKETSPFSTVLVSVLQNVQKQDPDFFAHH